MDAAAEATAELEREREQCVRALLELLGGWGVHLSTTPPQLVDELTRYGLACVDIGQRFVQARKTIHAPPRQPSAPFDHEDTPVRRPRRKDLKR